MNKREVYDLYTFEPISNILHQHFKDCIEKPCCYMGKVKLHDLGIMRRYRVNMNKDDLKKLREKSNDIPILKIKESWLGF